MHDWSSAYSGMEGWSVGCHPPPWECMWLLLRPIMMQWTDGSRERTISSWGSCGVPPQSLLVPSWDLSIEPLDSVELKFLSARQRTWPRSLLQESQDLQAFSVSEKCLVFRPAYSHIVLRPRPGYVLKVPTKLFRDQVVNLQALPSEEADPALVLLCALLIVHIRGPHPEL